ncbi:sigma-70 family RNA polymerase sigma factor [Clostridium intestinale]|uniref:RNA polymerase sigma factor, sigma-70 family n=1 Tax=Clostridium intestinale DSM 6191 TaxID=1121320 RepID=A0A1M6A3M1_9CLOT|nr:sigma-70 family RNA polymerase sigma factor [Clostridium intestinale]SHI31077.1 RNA polymerase sigma factor, sigma-70 family [Clostridium intestinale DSM 6191]
MDFSLCDYIKKFREGDIYSIEFLIQKFQPLLIKYANKLSDFDDAKSELSLHFIITLQKIPLDDLKFKNDKYILSYINTSIKRYYIFLSTQQSYLHSKEILTLDDYQPGIAYDTCNVEFYDLIHTLKIKEQKVLILKFIYNYTNTEISRVFNVSRQNVQVCITRSLIKLKSKVVF